MIRCCWKKSPLRDDPMKKRPNFLGSCPMGFFHFFPWFSHVFHISPMNLGNFSHDFLHFCQWIWAIFPMIFSIFANEFGPFFPWFSPFLPMNLGNFSHDFPHKQPTGPAGSWPSRAFWPGSCTSRSSPCGGSGGAPAPGSVTRCGVKIFVDVWVFGGSSHLLSRL